MINFSIGGSSRDAWSDSNGQALLGARDAGIFASVAAGNSGPSSRTMGSPANAPWVTAVAATTHNRKFVNHLTGMTGGPADITGAGVTAGYGPAKVVYAGDYILANDQASGDSLIGDAFALPGVAITYKDGLAVKAWLATAGTHTASISGASLDLSASNGDQMASFSSRGPDKTHPDVVKPDISAPGVDILAAINGPVTLGDAEYGILSGTSMAAPHITGAAALVRTLHATWTPAEVQSAMMMTAKASVTEGGKAVGPFARGAGRADLTKAALSGLVMNETAPNYLAANPASGGDPTTLNIPSVADSACEATCTWSRAPDPAWRSRRLAAEPCTYSLSPTRACRVGITYGCPRPRSRCDRGQPRRGSPRSSHGRSGPAGARA